MTDITARRIANIHLLPKAQRGRLQKRDNQLAERHARFFVSDVAELEKNITDRRRFAAEDECHGAALRKLEHYAAAARGDAAVQATRSARKLADAAEAAGMIVEISHTSASDGAPYFTIRAANFANGTGFEATFHTFKGKNGSYVFFSGTVREERGRRDIPANIKRMLELIASAGR